MASTEDPSIFEKKIVEQTAATAFQLVWSAIKGLGLKGVEEVKVRQAMARYAESYRERHGEVRVLGMRQPVPLHQIYTAVRVVHPDYLYRFTKPEELEDSYRNAGRQHLFFSKEESRSGIETANEEQFLSVLGAPGAGKSTFLRRLGQEAMLARSESEALGSDERLRSRYQHPLLPVLLEFRRFRNERGPVDLVAALTREFSFCGFPQSDSVVNSMLKGGKLLIILDGLDEVPQDRLDMVIDLVRDLVDQFDENRFVISCRTAHYKSYFTRFTDVILADFSDDQIGQFARNWFATATDIVDKTHERFLAQLEGDKNQSARELARTPLLLTFLCLTFDRDQSFPATRASLYKRALDILLREWAAEKRVHNEEIYLELHVDLEMDLLSEMALKWFMEGRYFFTREEAKVAISNFMQRQMKAPPTLDSDGILDAIERQQGLIVRRAQDAYSFSHLTIQEYLAAREIRANEDVSKWVSQHLFDNAWREVFILAAGIGKSDDLLQEMSLRIRSKVEGNPTFLKVVQWLNGLALDPDEDVERALSSRLVLTALAFALALDRARDRNVAVARALDHALYRAFALDRALDRARTVDPTRNRYRSPFLLDWICHQNLCQASKVEAISKVRDRLTDSKPDFQLAPIGLGLSLSDADYIGMMRFETILGALSVVKDCKDAAYRLENWPTICNLLLTVSDEVE